MRSSSVSASRRRDTRPYYSPVIRKTRGSERHRLDLRVRRSDRTETRSSGLNCAIDTLGGGGEHAGRWWRARRVGMARRWAGAGMKPGSAKLSLSDSSHLTARGPAGKLERGLLNFNI